MKVATFALAEILIFLLISQAFAFNIKVRSKFENIRFEPISVLYSNVAEKEFVFENSRQFKSFYLVLLSPEVNGEVLIEADPVIHAEETSYKIFKNQEFSLKLTLAAFTGIRFISIKDKITNQTLLSIEVKGSLLKLFRQRTSVNVENNGVRIYHDIRYKNNLMLGIGVRKSSEDTRSDLHISYEW